MHKIISPITLSTDVKLIQRIPSAYIVSKYRQLFNLDVTNYFINVSSIELYQCNKTQYRFFYPFDIAGDDLFYQKLQNIEWYYREWKWEFDIAYNLITPNSKVVEIGCGQGSFIRKLKNKATCIGLEINTESTQEGEITILNETIEKYASHHSEQLDWVVSFQVLEHIQDIRSYIVSSLKILKKGGRMIVAVPNNDVPFFKNRLLNFDDSSYQQTLLLNIPPHHMGQWNEQSFRNLEEYFPIKLMQIIKEPVQQWRKELNLKIWRTKYGLLGKVIFRFIRLKYLYTILSFLNKDYKYGDTILVVFEKQ